MRQVKSLVPYYFLILVLLASSWALFHPQFFRVHDFTHAGRIAEMARALGDGHFPVRWTQNFGYGYGMPLFEFYGPLPFYLGAVFYWMSNNAVLSIKLLYLICNAGTAIGGYLLGRKLFGSSGGLITAAALTLAPYRAVNLFVRGALNETWAIMFLPWILWGLIKIFHQEKRGWLVFSLSLAGLFLSHNITTMLLLPILALFAIGYLLVMFFQQAPELYRKGRFRGLNLLRIISQLVSSGLLAIGLAAFYLVPAFLEKDFTQVENFILTDYFNFKLHFLYIRQFFNPSWGYGGSSWGTDDGISFFLGWGQLAAMTLMGWFFIKRIWLWLRKKQAVWQSARELLLTTLFGGLLLVTFYLSLLKAQWLWELVPLLKFAQFPWRWLSLSVVLFSLLLGSLVWLVKDKIRRIYLSLVLVIIMAAGSFWYFQPEKYLADNNEHYYTDPRLIRHNLSGVLPDYISQNMATEPQLIPEQLVINEAEVDDDRYQVLADRTQQKLIKTSFSEETRLSLAVAEYPGWQLAIDTQRWDRQYGPDGNIEVLVPPGEHLVSLRFLDTPVRRYADWASLVSWLVLSYLLIPKNNLKFLEGKRS
jgi:hypothetical protein